MAVDTFANEFPVMPRLVHRDSVQRILPNSYRVPDK
jgi:hypothetical protein